MQGVWQKETAESGLVVVRMAVRPHKGKRNPGLPGTYYKFMLDKPPVDFLVPDPAAAASRNSREPFVLMHMPKQREQTRVFVPEPTTAVHAESPTPVDAAAQTPTDAPPTSPLAAGFETLPERPDSPDEVTGFIERLSLAGTASNSDGGDGGDSDGGGGAAASGGGAACAKCGIRSAALLRCARCLAVAYCGKK